MNGGIEAGFAAFIRPAMQGVPVREATSSLPLPSNLQLVVVECTEIEHAVGRLHRAIVKLHLKTPAFDVGESRHVNASSLLSRALLERDSAKLIFDADAAPITLVGYHVRSQSLETADNDWHSVTELIAGVSLG